APAGGGRFGGQARGGGWTDALPLAVAETAQGGCEDEEEIARGVNVGEHVLRVRIRSVRDPPNPRKRRPLRTAIRARSAATRTASASSPPGRSSRVTSARGRGGGRRRTTAVLRGWSEAMDAAAAGDAGGEEEERYLVCGAKGVGKSTLVRYVANRLLSGDGDCGEPGRNSKRRVAVLDLDCGQPELGPPGMLTLTVLDGPLLSEPPVHMTRRTKEGGSEEEETLLEHAAAHYLGDVSSRSDPDAYVAMAASLARRYESLRLEHRGSGSLPLVVNTDGWVKGLGGEVLSAAIASCRPRLVLQINGGTRAKSFELPPRIRGAAGVTVSVFPSYDCEEAGQAGCCPSGGASTDDEARPGGPSDGSSPRASASDRRDHRLVSYLLGGSLPAGVAFGREHGLSDPDDAIGDALARTRPYAVPLGCVDLYPSPGFLDGASPGECMRLRGARGDLVSEDVVESFSGAVVGLCSSGRRRRLRRPLPPCFGRRWPARPRLRRPRRRQGRRPPTGCPLRPNARATRSARGRRRARRGGRGPPPPGLRVPRRPVRVARERLGGAQRDEHEPRRGRHEEQEPVEGEVTCAVA
ncbi:hypothetical protein THAOC_33366, partial [Thalassiosira oceanica]